MIVHTYIPSTLSQECGENDASLDFIASPCLLNCAYIYDIQYGILHTFTLWNDWILPIM